MVDGEKRPALRKTSKIPQNIQDTQNAQNTQIARNARIVRNAQNTGNAQNARNAGNFGDNFSFLARWEPKKSKKVQN